MDYIVTWAHHRLATTTQPGLPSGGSRKKNWHHFPTCDHPPSCGYTLGTTRSRSFSTKNQHLENRHSLQHLAIGAFSLHCRRVRHSLPWPVSWHQPKHPTVCSSGSPCRGETALFPSGTSRENAKLMRKHGPQKLWMDPCGWSGLAFARWVNYEVAPEGKRRGPGTIFVFFSS